MGWMNKLWNLLRRRQLESELEEELQFHLDARIRDNIKAGMDLGAARQDAIRRFGNQTLSKELTRENDMFAWIDTSGRDLKYAFRSLRKSPGFLLTALLTLALGIGANTAIFSVINAVLLRPLPYRDPQRLLRIWETSPHRRINADRSSVSPANFLSWVQYKDLFEDVAATTSGLNQTLTLTGVDAPTKLMCDRVTGSFFRVLGVDPVLGRTFQAQEEQPGHDHVILLSYDLWKTRFGGDTQIIGRRLILDNTDYQVIGVLPSNFRSPDRMNSRDANFLLRPLNFDAKRATDRGEHFLHVVARLKPGITLEQVQSKLSAVAKALEAQDPPTDRGWGVRVVRLQDDIVQDSKRALLVLAGAVGFLLLISCTNVANLLLARGASQTREMAIRAALGAGRSRLVRQLLTQSLLLGVVGGVLGVLLAFRGAELLLALAPSNIPRLQESTIDMTVLAYTMLLSLSAGAIFGFAPAWAVTRTDVNATLKESSRTSTGSSAAGRLRRVLIAAEIAIALVLAIGATLLIRTFQIIQGIDPGYRAEKVIAMDIAPPITKYGERTERVVFFQQVITRVEALPGVTSVGVVTDFPLGGSGGGTFAIDGRTPPADFREWDAEFRAVSPDYFKTMNIPLLEGRSLTSHDTDKAMRVAVINRTMAQRFWPGESPIGARLRRLRPSDAPWITIVGIVGNVRHQGPTREPYAEVYFSYLQPFAQPLSTGLRFPFPRQLVVRTESDPLNLVPAIQREVWAVDKDQPVSQVRTLAELHTRSMSQQRFNMLLLTIFGAIGLVLASVGIYGVLSYSVTARVQEMGIRMALGAQRKQILATVVGQGMAPAILGILIGIAAAFAVTRLVSTLLFGVTPTDPITFAGVSLLFVVVAFLACCIPAWRATKVDPLIALRWE